MACSTSLFIIIHAILSHCTPAKAFADLTLRRHISAIDLSDSLQSADRFFSNSQVKANLILPSTDNSSNLEDNPAILEWTAQTPVAVACGSSILFRNENIPDDNNVTLHKNQYYYWEHIFSTAMDPSIPSVEHKVSILLNNVTISNMVDINTGDTLVNSDNIESSSNITSPFVSFRLFAFLPFGKGVLVSYTYALALPIESLLYDSNNTEESFNSSSDSTLSIPLTIYALAFDGEESFYKGNFETYPAPPFLKELTGEDSHAFSRGPCWETVQMEQQDSSVIVIGGSAQNTGACVCESGEDSFRRYLVDANNTFENDFVCNEDSSPLVNVTVTDGFIEFHLDIQNTSYNREGVATSFHYALDPSPEMTEGETADFSLEAFYDTDGKSDGNLSVTLHHGIVRAEKIETYPYAVLSLSSLPLGARNFTNNEYLVVGGVWIDSMMMIHYSRESRILLSDIEEFIPAVTTSSMFSVDSEFNITRESSLCPTGSLRNIALLQEGASILDVSSYYSNEYSFDNAIDGDSSTEWSSQGDGNNAFISVQLPYSSNVVYVDFHTRTMTSSAQIYKYQVEAGNDSEDNPVVASSCDVPDSSRSYECDLNLSNDDDFNTTGVRNVSIITFRVIESSGGNTGVIDLGVYGCNTEVEILESNMTDQSDTSKDGSENKSATDDDTTLKFEQVTESSGVERKKLSAFILAVPLISGCVLLRPHNII